MQKGEQVHVKEKRKKTNKKKSRTSNNKKLIERQKKFFFFRLFIFVAGIFPSARFAFSREANHKIVH